MICEYCGKEVGSGSEFCPHCGMPLEMEDVSVAKNRNDAFRKKTKNQLKPVSATQASNNTNTRVHTDVRVSGSMGTKLADGEVIVKEYNCANIRGVSGYLTVTNKRLMFNASGGNSRYSQEVSLSSVSGLTCYRGTNVDVPRLVFGIILAFVGVITLAFLSGSYFQNTGMVIGILFLSIGGILCFLAVRTAFQIAVYAKDVSISPIVVGEGPKSLLGNSALFAIVSTPTTDTDKMLNELGAMVQDLQSMGDLAIEKWQNAYDPRELPKL